MWMHQHPNIIAMYMLKNTRTLQVLLNFNCGGQGKSEDVDCGVY